VLLLNLGDEPPRYARTAAAAGGGLGPGNGRGRDVHALRAPVLVVGALTTLDRPEANGVEPTLDRGAGYELGTVLVRDLVGVVAVEVTTSLYSGGGFRTSLARSR
jgi:hypothetical protein